jgi:Sulfotransferase family
VTEPPRPLFLFSLPRSGSTLLQRLLAGHPQIATASEPWVLLPFLYTMRRPGVYAEYGHRSMVRAVEDFSGQLRGGREEYLSELRNFAMALYAGAMDDEAYFLDKTPRYHLVVDEIMELFPDGRFIFLWRQPLAVAASVIDSFGHGKWNLEKYSVDLVDGLSNLVAAAQRADPRGISVRYEDVVAEPQREVGRILELLGLDPAEDLPTDLGAERPAGRMGDRTGTEHYSVVSAEPLDKWRATLGTAYRKRWARAYLQGIGAERLAVMGYDFDKMRREVEALPASPRKLAPDLARSVHGNLNRRLAGRLTHPSRGERRRVAARGDAS